MCVSLVLRVQAGTVHFVVNGNALSLSGWIVYIGGEQDIRGFEIWGVTPIEFVASSRSVNVLNDDGSLRTQKVVTNGVISSAPVTMSHRQVIDEDLRGLCPRHGQRMGGDSKNAAITQESPRPRRSARRIPAG